MAAIHVGVPQHMTTSVNCCCDMRSSCLHNNAADRGDAKLHRNEATYQLPEPAIFYHD